MSVHVLSDVKKRSAAKGNTRLVLFELADQAGQDGWCVIRMATLARNVNAHEATIDRAVAWLIANDEIECFSGKDHGGSNVYRVLLSDDRPKGEVVVPDRVTDLIGWVPHSADRRVPQNAGPGTATVQEGVPQNAGPGAATVRDLSVPSLVPVSSPVTSPVAPVAQPATIIEAEPTRKQQHDQTALALVAMMGWDRDEIDEGTWGQIHKAAARIRQAGGEPAAVLLRARNYRLNHPDWELTPTALASWWADSATVRLKPDPRHIKHALRSEQIDQALIGSGR